jgi:single-strand DNA-binding protein
MSGTLNKVILIGNLGADPEVRNFEYSKIVRFPIATSESYTNREGQRVEQTEWHNIVVSKKGLADICEQYLRKGMKVYIEGKIRTRSWQDSSGQTKYMTEINCFEMTMLSANTDRSTGPLSSSDFSSTAENSQTMNDDLPF